MLLQQDIFITSYVMSHVKCNRFSTCTWVIRNYVCNMSDIFIYFFMNF
jgi:hypothetical protein